MTTVLQTSKVTVEDVTKVQELAAHLKDGTLSAVLMQLVAAVERGADIALLAADKELSPNEVAEILKVSRPYVYKLMDRDILAYREVGSHRRVAMNDLLEYMERHERANAYVSSVIANSEKSLAAVMNEAAVITDADLDELKLLD